MDYDYQLVGGIVLLVFGFVGVANAFVDKRASLPSMVVMGVGLVLVLWAWLLSGQMLTLSDIPNAVFRVMASIF